MDLMELGKKIRQGRLARNLSATALAKEVGTTTQTLLDIEVGETKNPGVWRIRKIADVLGLPLDWLTDDSADWPPPAVSFEDKAQREFLFALERVGERPPEDPQTAELLASFRQLDPTAQAQLIGIARGMALGRAESADDDAAEASRLYVKRAGEELEADGRRALAKRARTKGKGRKGAAG